MLLFSIPNAHDDETDTREQERHCDDEIDLKTNRHNGGDYSNPENKPDHPD